jgi:hypothetical protein
VRRRRMNNCSQGDFVDTLACEKSGKSEKSIGQTDQQIKLETIPDNGLPL